MLLQKYVTIILLKLPRLDGACSKKWRNRASNALAEFPTGSRVCMAIPAEDCGALRELGNELENRSLFPTYRVVSYSFSQTKR